MPVPVSVAVAVAIWLPVLEPLRMLIPFAAHLPRPPLGLLPVPVRAGWGAAPWLWAVVVSGPEDSREHIKGIAVTALSI